MKTKDTGPALLKHLDDHGLGHVFRAMCGSRTPIRKNKPMNLTEAEMTKLRNTKNASQWNTVCDEIKAARNGAYPPDWFAKMILTGLMLALAARWTRNPPPTPRVRR